MKNYNQFRLETIYIKVKNLGESIYYMSNILGFKYIRSEVGEHGVKAFLESNSQDLKKSIMFCIEQVFYGEYKGDITFGLKPVSLTYGESLWSLHLDGFKLIHFEYDAGEDSISYNNRITGFNDMELQNFIVENRTWEEAQFKYMQKLECKNPLPDDDQFPNELNNYPFCNSYLKEIQIKVNNLKQYQDVFIQLGFEVLPIEIDKSGFRNIQVVLNDQCEITLRLIETTESLKDLDVKEYVSFEIRSNSHREGIGSTFIDLSDIGYCFSNEVFDEEDNVIADHAELVTPDGINWRITEASPVETFF